MDSSWKKFERSIAKAVGGRRRGADTSNEEGGKTDIVHPAWGVECKLLAKSGHADILEAVRQAERNSASTQTPIAIVKRKRDRINDSLVVMRLETWLEWYGDGEPTDSREHPAHVVKLPQSYCANCGKPLVPKSCKMLCETSGCGYFLSCSDLEPV